MGSLIQVTVSSPKNAASFAELQPDSTMPEICAERLWHYFKKIACGNEAASFSVAVGTPAGATNASGTITFGTFGSLAASDTVQIGPNVFTCQTAACTLGTQTYQKVTDSATTAASLCAQINAYPPTALLGIATVVSNVVTFTSSYPGEAGNSISLVKSSSAITLSAATLTGGYGELVQQSLAKGVLTGTYASIAASTTTCVLGGVTLTCVATTPVAGDATFQKVTDLTTTMASLATCINSHAVLSTLGVATSNATTCTFTLYQYGIIGNYFTFVGGTGLAATGSGYLTGGLGGPTATATVYKKGY
jgi:hypothetical protein